ncbi:MAG: oligoendopeptidase F [Deltaproteobacteria bacterium]|nr:MAG: oligoendopeptidase F [Deltaproteobacteria bacterium]
MTTAEKQYGAAEVIWDLSDFYTGEDDPQLAADIEWCRSEAADLEASFAGGVSGLTADRLHDLVGRIERLESCLQKLQSYAFLHACTQRGNEKAGRLEQRIRELSAECAAGYVFFALEWNQIPDERCALLLADEILAGYRYYLANLRRHRPHLLSEPEEKILIEKGPVGRSSWVTLFDKIFANYKFGEDGRSEEDVLTDLYSRQRAKRKRAADDMTGGLQENSIILTHIFNVLAADKMIIDRLRGHASWISSMNLENCLEDRTVEILNQAVTARYDIVARYYAVKRRLLGLDLLEDYDRYAPLESLPELRISWSECRRIVLEAFAGFSEKMAEIAEGFFEKSWIHAPVLHGKQGGAFAHPCVPEIHPYVLVNYNGTLNDVSTVAHELGHGVHQVLAARQGLYNSDTPLPLAETASVFAELLVFKSQLSLLQQPEERRAFICQKLESIFATVFRQTAMNQFEQAMHNGRRQHGELSCEQLSGYWLETQRAMFGDSVHLREDYGLWWSYIPHFLATPGYVYSYAFGELLVLALYGLYQKEGAPFVDKYIQLLAAGGSSSPYELLKPFAIDLDDPAFWNRGLLVIEEMLEQVLV